MPDTPTHSHVLATPFCFTFWLLSLPLALGVSPVSSHGSCHVQEAVQLHEGGGGGSRPPSTVEKPPLSPAHAAEAVDAPEDAPDSPQYVNQVRVPWRSNLPPPCRLLPCLLLRS